MNYIYNLRVLGYKSQQFQSFLTNTSNKMHDLHIQSTKKPKRLEGKLATISRAWESRSLPRKEENI